MAEEWRPGSFTKNFSWGPKENGLMQLYEVIKLGFGKQMVDVPRELFRERVARANRPDYIPINFFLFNKIINGVDFIVADELVFQALNGPHSRRFDKLALFAFNFSYVGKWRGASAYQRRPALWAFHYVADRLARQLGWNVGLVTADDIEKFVVDDPRYIAKTARKLATNLNYLYRVGRLTEFADSKVERWWVDALFLALDRLMEDRIIDGLETQEAQYEGVLMRSNFQAVSGRSSIEKELATKHLLTLYTVCGGRSRFSEDEVKNRTTLALPDVAWLLANDDDTRPKGAVHPTNPGILKTIPRSCAMLARYAGFDIIDADELENFDVADFVRRHTRDALARLRDAGVQPLLSADEITKITRER